jgi:protease-4
MMSNASTPENSSESSPQPTENPSTSSAGGGGSSPTIVIQQSGFSRNLGRIFFWAGWLGFVICLVMIGLLRSERKEYYDTTGGIQERYHSGSKTGKDKIAIITIRGVIFEGDGFVKRQIDRIRDDENVKAVVVRVDSPGGTVAGSDYIYHHLDKLKREKGIPLVVSMGSIAASGGYYVSMAVGKEKDSIFAEPTTVTGSIGVIIPHYDIYEFLKKHGVVNDSIASGDRKQMLSMTKPITEEHREILQEHVNDFFNRFKEIITRGRPVFSSPNEESTGYEIVDAESGRNLATGEVFTAYRAKDFGLVDRIGFLEDAIKRATEIAKLDKDTVRVVSFQRPPSLMDLTGFAQAQGQSNIDLSAFLELSSPRAYYLASSLPPLVSSRRAD